MTTREFLTFAVGYVFAWPTVERVTVALMPSFRFEDNGLDGMVTVWLTGDLKCSCVVSSDKIQYCDGHAAYLLEPLRRMVEAGPEKVT